MKRWWSDVGHRVRTKRWGRRVPVAFLTVSLVVAGFGALEAFRAQRSHADTTADLLRDDGEFAAWSYERISWELLQSSLDRHLEITYSNSHFAGGEATKQCLASILHPGSAGSSCNCSTDLAGSYAFFTRVDDPPPQSSLAAWPTRRSI